MVATLKRPVDPSLAAGFGLVALLVGVLGLVTYWNTSRLVSAARWVEHTRVVLTDLDALFATLKDAEAGERGYVITGDPSFLEPYRTALSSLSTQLVRIQQLVSDRADEARYADRLARLVSEQLHMLRTNIALRDSAGIEAAARNMRASHARVHMDAIRSLVRDMQRQERTLLSRRTSDTESVARAAVVTLSLGGILLFVFLGVIWLLLRRGLVQRHAVEQELWRLASIVSSSEDAIVGETLDGKVTSWNDAAERLFGYSAAEMFGRSVAILEPPGLEGNTSRTLVGIQEGRRILQFDTTRLRKDGTEIAVSVSVSPIRDSAGRLVGASKIVRDIRGRKEGERQLRLAKEAAESANRAKDEFLAVLSHELRTPLTPALLTAEMLERRDLPADVRRSVSLIRRNVELEARLVNDLLDVNRIAHGKIELKRESVDLHGLVESAMDTCRGETVARRQTLSIELAASEHHADADPARMQQVLWNLVQNAVQFTDEGGIIRLGTDNPAPGTFRFRVSDTGRGIAPEMLSRIFEPFEQGSPRAGKPRKGLGLGLAISKALIELHGGSIAAESAGEGRGATFAITLPAREDGAGERPPQDVERGTPGKSLTILLAEDHPDTAHALSRLLEEEGHRVFAVSSVEAAMTVGRDCAVDLLITDLGLPDGTGHQLLGLLREIRPVEGVVLSGYGMDADVARSRRAGFLDHLTKPVNVSKLLRVIDGVTPRA